MEAHAKVEQEAAATNCGLFSAPRVFFLRENPFNGKEKYGKESYRNWP
jgi:hypothetical protein